MKKIEKLISVFHLTTEQKQYAFIMFNVLICGIMGAVLWAVIGRYMLSSLSWLFCFIGYPAVFIGFCGSILYLYRK